MRELTEILTCKPIIFLSAVTRLLLFAKQCVSGIRLVLLDHKHFNVFDSFLSSASLAENCSTIKYLFFLSKSLANK